MQDFAGSSVVHLTGATAALAALLLLGPRRGKYGTDGRSRVIPGHSMPHLRARRPDPLGRLVRLQRRARRSAPAASASPRWPSSRSSPPRRACIGASITCLLILKKLDVGMAGNGAIAGLVGITAPSGYVEFYAAPIIGLVAGVLVVVSVLAIDRKLDDPVGALSAHGMAGIWGTLACGLFTSERLAETVGGRQGRALRGRRLRAAGRAGGRGRRSPSPPSWSSRSSCSPRSRRPSGCGSAPTRRRPGWTSPSTACTAIRSSSSPHRSWSASPRPPQGRGPVQPAPTTTEVPAS